MPPGPASPAGVTAVPVSTQDLWQQQQLWLCSELGALIWEQHARGHGLSALATGASRNQISLFLHPAQLGLLAAVPELSQEVLGSAELPQPLPWRENQGICGGGPPRGVLGQEGLMDSGQKGEGGKKSQRWGEVVWHIQFSAGEGGLTLFGVFCYCRGKTRAARPVRPSNPADSPGKPLRALLK